MSGRSAYVRKEKTKVKDGSHESISDKTGTSLSDFPMPMQTQYEDRHNSEILTVKSSGSEDMGRSAYARVRKPHVPVIEVSGIEKSSFRSVMDKKSESIRKGLVKTFGKKKKNGELESRPHTSTAFRSESHELDSGDYVPPAAVVRPGQQHSQHQDNEPEFARPGPPQTKLPPIPAAPGVKRWVGGSRPAQPWNKIRKDPELWDNTGDTLIFLGLETRQSTRPSPSIRLSSHIIENTDSRLLVTLLHEGMTDEANYFGMPPSPVSSPGMRSVQPTRQGHHYTPPVSDGGTTVYEGYDGQISYEINFPTPINQSPMENMRYNITTRNVFAMLCGASLVGFNVYQALNDLVERLRSYYSEDVDVAHMVIEWISSRGFDDVRNNPSMAAGLLAWSESDGVRWENGWREAFVHCCGMYNQVEATPEYKHVPHFSKQLVSRGDLKMSIRVQLCEERLAGFDFQEDWPEMQEYSPSRAAFLRLQKFFVLFYRSSYGSWPPPTPEGHDQWLHRPLAQKLHRDFAALYDYFVNRDIVWYGSEERSGRKWNLVNPADVSFQADTSDCLFTDLIVAFDNKRKFPHIPQPYPLVPEALPKRSESKENLLKTKKSNTPQEERNAERLAALAYTESTNIYLLGSDYVNNDLVDAFIKFERGDRAGDANPYAARRGRWVLIYYVLQTLATVSVDAANIRYTHDVMYHISPGMAGTPPWNAAKKIVDEANHYRSHCWLIPATWPRNEQASPNTMAHSNTPYPLSIRSAPPSVASSDAESSLRSPTMNSINATSMGHKSRRAPRKDYHEGGQYNGHTRAHRNDNYEGGQYNGHGHAHHRQANQIDEWPGQEESTPRGQPGKELLIKDFDDYNF
jgi:hypothetical protein